LRAVTSADVGCVLLTVPSLASLHPSPRSYFYALSLHDALPILVYVSLAGQYQGAIVVADTVKPDAKATLAGLKASGIGQTVMLRSEERRVGKECGDSGSAYQ